ncbi:coiled-coil domain-containing protein 87-like [Narcine bancroftii]|uniref:coiled-coil domain-containing protein 87-like n=1 Tax=Narcine bancroftii TaxID=1343680 RepID=UPI0038316F2B
MTESLNVAVMENKSSRFPNGNALYSTMRSPAVAKEIHQRYKDLLEPLSLFTPQIKNIDIPVLHLERPVTPIDQNVKLAPTSLSDLCQLIQRRIAARSDIKTVSMATQQELGGIIAADVKLLWEDFELYSHDNALTKMESRELSRRITTHIVTVCEQLFFHYLHMVDIVRQRSVFTDEANLSRLKAQLALDCTKFLNIPSIKRQIAEEIKTSRISGEIDDEILEMENLGKYKDKVTKSTSPAAPFSFKCLFNLSRPKRASKPKKKTIENDLKEINDNMPHLDVEKYYNESLHKVESAEDHRPMQIIAVRNLNLQAQQNEEVSTKSIQPEHEVNVKKWKSSHKNSVKTILSKGQNIHGCSTASDLKSLLDFCQSKDEKNEPFSIAEDLHNLLEISTVEQGNDAVPESTLPPLIEAIMYDESNEIKKCRQQKILKELEEEESELRHSVQPNKPEHAQPDFVSIRLSQKLMARTADVRVSDRQFIDSVYLKIYPPIYNHHQEEFDQEMVKTLDKNLSFAEELQEIYKELLDMIPSDYLLFDEDPIIVPPAVNVDLAGCFPSDTLSRSLKERVINPKLKLLDSDYGTERYLLMKKEGEDPNFSSDNQLNQQDLNINSNDYLKYVLSQGSDFLGVLYHFYESEEEKDEERRALVVRELELKQEEEMQIAETRLVKEKFLSGLWNVNAVMLGGLGKEPLPKGTILGPHDARGRDYKLSLLQMNLTLGSIKK